MRHCYEQSKQKFESKHELKRNKKGKGKWPPKQGIPQYLSEKEIAVPYKRFNTDEKGHGEKQARGSGMELLECWICGKDHHKRDCSQYQSGGRPHIYSYHEAHIMGDASDNIPHIYGVVDSRRVEHQE